MLSYWMQTVNNKTVLEQRDIERPTPGPKQILLRLHAASLNRGEFVIGHGLHKGGQASAIGMEGAGVIAAMAAGAGAAVQDVPLPELHARLAAQGAVLCHEKYPNC